MEGPNIKDIQRKTLITQYEEKIDNASIASKMPQRWERIKLFIRYGNGTHAYVTAIRWPDDVKFKEFITDCVVKVYESNCLPSYVFLTRFKEGFNFTNLPYATCCTSSAFLIKWSCI
jgi:hypothetical protein